MNFEKKEGAENKEATEKIIDLMAEMMRKDNSKRKETKGVFSQKEALEKITDADEFIDQLSEIIKENREKGEKSRIILATYNRVGRGESPNKISRPDLSLDIWQASPNIPPSEEEIKKFFKKTAESLEKQLMYAERGPIVVFYGGSGENFEEAAKTIDNLDSLTALLDEKQKPKFFLLTCRCQLEGKAKTVLPLIQNNRLSGLIYGKEGDCGGFNDLQKIADSLLREKKKEEAN